MLPACSDLADAHAVLQDLFMRKAQRHVQLTLLDREVRNMEDALRALKQQKIEAHELVLQCVPSCRAAW